MQNIEKDTEKRMVQQWDGDSAGSWGRKELERRR